MPECIWKGSAGLYDARDSSRSAVVVEIQGDRVRIEPGGLEMLHRDVAEAGLTGTGDARLRFRTHPALVLTVTDTSGVAALRRIGVVKAGLAGWLDETRALLWIAAALLVGFVVLLRFGLQPMAAWSVRFIPESVDEALGRAAWAPIVATAPLNHEPEEIAALERCVAALWEGAGQTISVALIEDSTVANAFALPGRRIVVYRGLLSKMRDQDELLGVLAHEIGHAELRHGVKRLAREASLGLVLALVFGDSGNLAAFLTRNAARLAALSHDRGEEREADDFAIERLRSRGIDPSGLARLFETLDRTATGAPPVFLSTHPSSRERIKRIEAARGAGGEATVLSDEEWDRLRGR